MGDEEWDIDIVKDSAPAQVSAELPEVKLFGRWSCEDVEVSDMSLQVQQSIFNFILLARFFLILPSKKISTVFNFDWLH